MKLLLVLCLLMAFGKLKYTINISSYFPLTFIIIEKKQQQAFNAEASNACYDPTSSAYGGSTTATGGSPSGSEGFCQVKNYTLISYVYK
jgi:hypothetical protein